jgi:hypothetical protein
MSGVRFYLEPTGPNVYAAFPENVTPSGCIEGLGAVFEYGNSPVASTSASRSFLRGCKRISEAKARQVHPALFQRLDD